MYCIMVSSEKKARTRDPLVNVTDAQLGNSLARPKIHSHSQIFRHGRIIICLPHWLIFSDIFDLPQSLVKVTLAKKHVRKLFHVAVFLKSALVAQDLNLDPNPIKTCLNLHVNRKIVLIFFLSDSYLPTLCIPT